MEPLKTDELLPPGAAKAPKDMDTAMLGGCSVFLVTAVVTFFVAVWPHLAYPHAEQLKVLRTCLLLGLPPSLVAGIIGARKGGLAGACGFVSGALTTGVFFFLRLQQIFVTAGAQTGPEPNYPSAVMYILPTAWFIVSVAIGFAATPRMKSTGLGAENNH